MKASEAYREQRSEERVAGSFRLFVHVQVCEKVPELVGKSIVCEAVDVSKRGIQIRAGVEVPEGTVLNVAAAVGKPFAMYLLEGEVRWQHNVGSGKHMGILLLDGEDTDYQKWTESFDSTIAWIEYLASVDF